MNAKFPTTLFTYLSVNETNGIIFAKEETLDEGQVVSEHETTYLRNFTVTKDVITNHGKGIRTLVELSPGRFAALVNDAAKCGVHAH